MSTVVQCDESLLRPELYLARNPHVPSEVIGASPETQVIVSAVCEWLRHSHDLAMAQQETTRARFQRLSTTWRDETRMVSSTTQLTLHPAYQEIIGIGPDAVPLILDKLRREGGHWFMALRAITGIDVVRDEDRGRVAQMREAWLKWGRAQGLVD